MLNSSSLFKDLDRQESYFCCFVFDLKSFLKKKKKKKKKSKISLKTTKMVENQKFISRFCCFYIFMFICT